ncbi:MAG: hypothetical protein ACKOXM_03480 [Agromyces sp.]
MDKFWGVLVAVLVVGSALVGMFRSWSARRTRDAHIELAESLDSGETFWTGRLQYVASTRASEKLDRLAIRGGAFRGWADMRVSSTGISIQVQGEPVILIPAHALLGVTTDSWTIDRGTGAEGLVRLHWTPESPIDFEIYSFLRVTDATEQTRLLDALVHLSSPQQTTEPRA